MSLSAIIYLHYSVGFNENEVFLALLRYFGILAGFIAGLWLFSQALEFENKSPKGIHSEIPEKQATNRGSLANKETKDTDLTHEIMGFSVNGTYADGHKWRLKAKEAFGREELGTWSLVSPEIFYEEKSNNFLIEAHSKSGEVIVKPLLVELSGDIRARTGNNYSFYLEKLSFDEKDNSIYSNDKITIIQSQKKITLDAGSFYASEKKEVIFLKNKITLKQRDENNKLIKIKSDEAQVYSGREEVLVKKNIQVHYLDWLITGDVAKLFYTRKGVQFDRLEFGGTPVRATVKDLKLRANKVIYLPKKKAFVLLGSPKVWYKNSHTIEGEEILVFIETKEVQIRKGTALADTDKLDKEFNKNNK